MLLSPWPRPQLPLQYHVCRGPRGTSPSSQQSLGPRSSPRTTPTPPSQPAGPPWGELNLGSAICFSSSGHTRAPIHLPSRFYPPRARPSVNSCAPRYPLLQGLTQPALLGAFQASPGLGDCPRVPFPQDLAWAPNPFTGRVTWVWDARPVNSRRLNR